MRPPAHPSTRIRALGSSLVHSVGGSIVLLVVLVLNVYKPTGLTPYGWRKQREERRDRSGATRKPAPTSPEAE